MKELTVLYFVFFCYFLFGPKISVAHSGTLSVYILPLTF
jgi:hypothetical protein